MCNDCEHHSEGICTFDKPRTVQLVQLSGGCPDGRWDSSTGDQVNAVISGAAKIAQAAMTTLTDKAKQRLKVCEGCPEFANGRCQVCGCFARFKVRLDNENCPLGNW